MLLAREFGWTLDEMRRLKCSELVAILSELQKQRALQDYQEMHSRWAFLAAVITNGFMAVAGMFGKKKHKTIKPEDFFSDDAKKTFRQLLGQKPKAKKDLNKHIEDAKAKGLSGPW